MFIVAHRGLHTRAPENSLAAIRAALAAGFDRIEVDVRATSDGRLVLMHDQTLSRTTSGRGPLRLLRADDLADVRLADGSSVPSLDDAFELCQGKAVLCLDVKEPEIAGAAIDEATRAAASIEIWSTHRQAVALAADRGLFTAWISLGLFPKGGPEALAAEARELGANAVSFFPADLSARAARACQRLGLAVMSGTPNDRGTWAFMLDLGASTVITDRPEECRDWLANAPNSLVS